MPHIILDVVIDEGMDVHEFAADTSSLYDLKVNVLNENGPAGGWPEIRFEGNRKRLEAFIRVYSGHDPRMYEDLFEMIVE